MDRHIQMTTLRQALAEAAMAACRSVPDFRSCMRTDLIIPRNANFVCKVQLLPHPEDMFNLRVLARLPFAKFDKVKFTSVTLRMNETMVKVFATGNVIMMRGRSRYGSLYLMHRYRLLFESLPMTLYDRASGRVERNGTLAGRLGFEGWVVVNVVANGYVLQDNIMLGKLSDENADECTYAPDNFPGAKWASILPSSGCEFTVKIFGTGKIVYMGIKSNAEAREAHEIITKVLAQYEDHNVPDDPRLRSVYRLGHILSRAGFSHASDVVTPVIDLTGSPGTGRTLGNSIAPMDFLDIKNEKDDEGKDSSDDDDDDGDEAIRNWLHMETLAERRSLGPTLMKAAQAGRVQVIQSMVEAGAVIEDDLWWRPNDEEGSQTLLEYLSANAADFVAMRAILSIFESAGLTPTVKVKIEEEDDSVVKSSW